MGYALEDAKLSDDLKLDFTQKRKEVVISDRVTSEIVIGLCGPLGTPLKETSLLIKDALENVYDYEVVIIKLSNLISTTLKLHEPSDRYERTTLLINKGNTLREKYGASILAELAILEISADRNAAKAKDDMVTYKPRRKCFIIDSIKSKDELTVLRQVYGSLFYCVGVYSPLKQRVENLKRRMTESNIYELIDRDSGEETDSGQKVEKTFPLADYFLRFDSAEISKRKAKVKLMLNIFFRTGVASPSTSETAMYSAYSAAANSACLSRQVGAAIINSSGELVSVGWNDVPKFGGSLYRSGSENDKRCYNYGELICTNDKEKNSIIEKIIDTAKNNIGKIEILKSTAADPAKSEGIMSLIRACLKESRIDSLIEFSKAIHAEMHAIISAPFREKLIGAELYCTTYPCHACARHIVAAGINKVQFIEPYKKSLATALHEDSITEDENDKEKLQLIMYEGVSPRRYLEFFKENEFPRKLASGKYIEFDFSSSAPKSKVMMESFPALERFVLQNLVSRGILPDEEHEEDGHAA